MAALYLLYDRELKKNMYYDMIILSEIWKRRYYMSATRKKYIIRLIARCVILVACVVMYLAGSAEFQTLEGMNFFNRFSVFHILWVIWVVDMIQQIIPLKNRLPLGSMKLFASRYRPSRQEIHYEALHQHIVTTTKAAYKVFLLWCALLAVIGTLYYTGIINKQILFLISVTFYVCDLICVLIWCPFRLMMKTRCCTTCRIFNWDHLMMFSPLFFIGGFFGLSLAFLAAVDWLVWELCVMMYPERFWDKSNMALKCSECTDKLCTQYCQKSRR